MILQDLSAGAFLRVFAPGDPIELYIFSNHNRVMIHHTELTRPWKSKIDAFQADELMRRLMKERHVKI